MSLVAIITGGAKGIGKAFAEAILKKGGKVCIADLDDVLGQYTVENLKTKYGQDKAIFVKCDVTNVAEFRNVFEKTKQYFSRIDIVCNNAGILNNAQWKKMMNINLVAVIQGTYLAREYMGKDRGGHGGLVVNLSSMAGVLAVPDSPAYAASKHGVVGFTSSYAKNYDFINHGVRMNVLCPSCTDTDMYSEHEKTEPNSNMVAYVKQFGLISPLKIAEAFMMLVEDESQNGSVLTITNEKGFLYWKNSPM